MDNTTKKKTEPFFLVMKDKGDNKRMQTKKRHIDRESAISEAERLATEVGGKFYVTQLVAIRSGKKKSEPVDAE